MASRFRLMPSLNIRATLFDRVCYSLFEYDQLCGNISSSNVASISISYAFAKAHYWFAMAFRCIRRNAMIFVRVHKEFSHLFRYTKQHHNKADYDTRLKNFTRIIHSLS